MFITTSLLNRRPLFLQQCYALEAVDQLFRVQILHPFLLFGFVIMPDHCHFLLTVNAPETITRVITSYKSGLAHQIGLGPIWQPRFHLRLPEHPWKTWEYIHMNPVKAGLVANPEDYNWSSANKRWRTTSLDGIAEALQYRQSIMG